MFHTSKTTIAFSTMAIVALVLLFATGPILGNQALAANLCGSGFCGQLSGGNVLHSHGPGSHHSHGGFLHH